jgi:hypothetical protein
MSEENIQFRFAGIEIISKSLSEIRYSGIPISNSVNFEVKVEIKVQAERKMILPYITVKIKSIDNGDILASFVIACFFDIPNFEADILLDEQGLHLIPTALDLTIRPVSISTVRGIIWAELRGTYLQNTIMPVVYISDFTVQPSTPVTQ